MKPRISLRQSLQDPNLLGTAIAGDSWTVMADTADCGDGRRAQ